MGHRNSFAFAGLVLGLTLSVSCGSSVPSQPDVSLHPASASVIASAGPQPRQVPEAIEKELRGWSRSAQLLRAAQVGLSLAAIVASLLVATNVGVNSFKASTLKWIAFLSALATGILSAFDPGGEANRMRNAWRTLNTAIIRYQIGASDLKEVVAAYERGESAIGDYTVEIRREGENHPALDTTNGDAMKQPSEGNRE